MLVSLVTYQLLPLPNEANDLSDSVAEDIDPQAASTDESSELRSESLESHGRYLPTYTIAHAITLNTFSRFCNSCSPNSYRFPFPSVASSRTLHSTTRFGRLYGLLLYDVHRHGLLINCIDQKSCFIQVTSIWLGAPWTATGFPCECNHDEK